MKVRLAEIDTGRHLEQLHSLSTKVVRGVRTNFYVKFEGYRDLFTVHLDADNIMASTVTTEPPVNSFVLLTDLILK